MSVKQDRPSRPDDTEIRGNREPPIKTSDQIIELQEMTYIRWKRLVDLVMMDNVTGKIYPGALLFSKPIQSGILHEPTQISNRANVTVTISGPTIQAPSCTHTGTHSSFMENCSPVILNIASVPVRFDTDFEVSSHLEEALLDMGMSAKYWKAQINSSHLEEGSKKRSFAVFSLNQTFYSMTTDAPPEGGYLSAEALSKSPSMLRYLQSQMELHGELLYVRKVDFGRRIMIILSSETDKETLHRALQFDLNAIGSGSSFKVDEETSKAWTTIKGQMIVVGGQIPAGVSPFFSGHPNAFFATLQAVMQGDNINYSPEHGGIPISFELAYLSDGFPFQVYESTDFAGSIPIVVAGRHVINQPIQTRGQDAAVLRQDAEVDSDDWTLVQIKSQNLRLSNDRRTVYFDLVWRVYEGESSKSIRGGTDPNKRGKTIIESRRTFEIRMQRPVREFASPATTHSAVERWYAGEVHNETSFPNTGFLKNIRVKFDARGRHDDQVQSLKADLNFDVWLEGD